MKIISVVGARPNFMKVAPIHRAIANYNSKSSSVSDRHSTIQPFNHSNEPDRITHLICHTGQHYDEKMSKIFFQDLELPEPDFYLGVGSGTHAEQTGKVMIEFEKVLLKEKPDYVLVVGDVNSTIACTLTAAKLHIKTIHVEAGLRSGDRMMPEEVNRVLTDSISDLLFVTEESGIKNLTHEGVPEEKVYFTGNVMIDSVAYYLSKAEKSNILNELSVEVGEYILVTLHRPSNVDEPEQLRKLIGMLNRLAERRKVIFPVHPRTRKNLENQSLMQTIRSEAEIPTRRDSQSVHLCDPIGYIDFLALTKKAELILTDSGGIQEESTYLGVQCITLRDSTERPVTVDIGTNQLLGSDLIAAEKAANEILDGNLKNGGVPELWDGYAAERIVKVIIEHR